MDRLLSQLEEMSCTCSHPLSYTSAAKCFAGLVNKRTQGQFVCLNSLQSQVLVLNARASSCQINAIVMVCLFSSSGDSLDSLIQRTMKRVCSELDSTSSSVRTQAFTLMIWVRASAELNRASSFSIDY